MVTTAEIVGLHTELPRLEWAEDLGIPTELLLKPGLSRMGTDATLEFARQIPQPQLNPAPEVLAQLEQVEVIETQLSANPAHQWQNQAALLKLQRRAAYLQEQLNYRQAKLDEQSQRHWEEFLHLIEILQSFGALEGLSPTTLGLAIAAIRGDNELWLGLALASGELDDLDPHHLAAACAALVTEVSRSDGGTRNSVSKPVEAALAGLRSTRRQLFQLQRRYSVVLPLWLEYELVELVEQWALGVEWLDLCASTSLDEGDIVRILRRTLDFLSQVPYIPCVSNEIRQNAYRATHLINRFPINEVV